MPNNLKQGLEELTGDIYLGTTLFTQGTGKLPQEDIVRFTVEINTINPFIQDGNLVSELEDSETLETDWGVLMLPTSYTRTGTPTRLVIGCHGGGGTVKSNTSQTETFDLYKYLVSLGYAVMDMAGMPAAYATRNVIDLYRVMGSYFSANAYQKGYEWVIENYNINENGVFINGGSNGGLTSMSIQKYTNIPIIAMSGMSPLLSMLENAWVLTTASVSGGWATSYGNRLNIIKIYGMADPVVYEADGITIDVTASQANLIAATFEADKVIGFDPFTDGVVEINGVKQKHFPVPYKIWQPINDSRVYIAVARTFRDMLKNGGSNVVLREMASGGHSPETAGSVLGTFTYLGSTYNLYPAVAELAMWYKRFN